MGLYLPASLYSPGYHVNSFTGINHEFCTETIGVDKSYSNESFYTDEMKGSFSEEELRVNKRFAEATENGVFVKKTAVDLKSLVDSISHNQVFTDMPT